MRIKSLEDLKVLISTGDESTDSTIIQIVLIGHSAIAQRKLRDWMTPGAYIDEKAEPGGQTQETVCADDGTTTAATPWHGAFDESQGELSEVPPFLV